jgi:hypothetical protein
MDITGRYRPAGLAFAVASLLVFGCADEGGAPARAAELTLPDTAQTIGYDFESSGVDDWTMVTGRWTAETMSDAPSGQRALVQRAVDNDFDVIVAPAGPFTDIDVSMRFKPMSGRIDASGGIVFRFDRDRYYVIRANALENNVRLYYYDGGRHQLASARVPPPALGQWHTLRVVNVGDRIQAYLDNTLLIDHRDGRFRTGRVGLWTKADSVTAFDDLTIRGIAARGG